MAGLGLKTSALHAVAELDLRHGGPSRSIVALADALAQTEQCRVGLAASSCGADSRVLESAPAVERFEIVSTKGRVLRPAALGYRKGVLDAAAKLAAVIIHSHGIWRAENHWLAGAARSLGILHIAQPRGMLSAWALEHKRTKKQIAWHLYQRRDLRLADGLVATSENELQDIRSLGLRGPVAVIPNGVKLPELSCSEAAKALTGGRTILFLSRLHRGKGLLELLRAWARVRPEGWRLRVAGPDVDGLWPEAAALCEQAGLHEVSYLGEVDSLGASALYREADLFVLPTRSENFGMVIAEALAHSLPVLTTRGAPWQDLIRYDCGWWIDLGEDALEHGLREATSLSSERLERMGQNGRCLAERYTWQAAAEKTLHFYRWLLEGGSPPEFVHVIESPKREIQEKL